MHLAMIQDKILQPSQLVPANLDRGLYFGDGVYEVIRSYNGRIFALDEHFSRLSHSLAAIGMTGVDIELVRSRVDKAFKAADLPDVRIYFHITRGCAPRNHIWQKDLSPNFFLTVEKLEDFTEFKKKGVWVSTHPDLRWKRCDIKSLNLLPNVLAKADAAKKGCAEAILIDEQTGLITEGAASAFFAVFGNKLQTAPTTANILPSVTRKFVIKAARNIGMEVIEESLTPQQGVSADELFLAATTKDILAVVKFDDKQIAEGQPGKHTKQLAQEFRTFTE